MLDTLMIPFSLEEMKKGAKIEIFEAQVFSESEAAGAHGAKL